MNLACVFHAELANHGQSTLADQEGRPGLPIGDALLNTLDRREDNWSR